MSCFQGQRGLDVHCLRTLIFSSTGAGADDVTDGEGVQNKSQWTKSQMTTRHRHLHQQPR